MVQRPRPPKKKLFEAFVEAVKAAGQIKRDFRSETFILKSGISFPALMLRASASNRPLPVTHTNTGPHVLLISGGAVCFHGDGQSFFRNVTVQAVCP